MVHVDRERQAVRRKVQQLQKEQEVSCKKKQKEAER